MNSFSNNNSTNASGALLDKESEMFVDVIYRLLVSILERPEFVDYKPAGRTNLNLMTYIRHVVRTSRASSSCLVTAGIFINRFIAAWPNATLQTGGAHRIFLTSLMLACKVVEDATYTAKTWSRIGMFFPLGELNACEAELLSFLGFRMHVDAAEYEATVAYVRAAYQQEYEMAAEATLTADNQSLVRSGSSSTINMECS